MTVFTMIVFAPPSFFLGYTLYTYLSKIISAIFFVATYCHVQHENWVTFLDFQLPQGSVATYCRQGGNLCHMYIENFPANHLVKEFWKTVHIFQSYYQTSSGLLFSEYGVESTVTKKALAVFQSRRQFDHLFSPYDNQPNVRLSDNASEICCWPSEKLNLELFPGLLLGSQPVTYANICYLIRYK